MIKSRVVLERWYKTFFYGGWTTENGTVRLNKEYETIDKDLDRLEKLEKVIKILKNKVVNLTVLNDNDCDTDKLYYWNNYRNDFVATRQEYELLKEVLEDGK